MQSLASLVLESLYQVPNHGSTVTHSLILFLTYLIRNCFLRKILLLALIKMNVLMGVEKKGTQKFFSTDLFLQEQYVICTCILQRVRTCTQILYTYIKIPSTYHNNNSSNSSQVTVTKKTITIIKFTTVTSQR